MNDLREMAAKMRKIADSIDELIGKYGHNENAKTAKKIVKKLHWTQKPENKRKMRKNIEKAIKAKSK